MIITKHGKYWILGDTEKRKHSCPECESPDVKWEIRREDSVHILLSTCHQCGCQWATTREE